MAKYGGESWMVNKAVHYTEWADFSKSEFKSVVEAFKGLLLQFRCTKPGCESWLYVTPSKGESGGAPLPLCIDQPQSQGKVIPHLSDVPS